MVLNQERKLNVYRKQADFFLLKSLGISLEELKGWLKLTSGCGLTAAKPIKIADFLCEYLTHV